MKDTKARDTKDGKNTWHKGHKTQVRVLNITALKTRNEIYHENTYFVHFSVNALRSD